MDISVFLLLFGIGMFCLWANITRGLKDFGIMAGLLFIFIWAFLNLTGLNVPFTTSTVETTVTNNTIENATILDSSSTTNTTESLVYTDIFRQNENEQNIISLFFLAMGIYLFLANVFSFGYRGK